MSEHVTPRPPATGAPVPPPAPYGATPPPAFEAPAQEPKQPSAAKGVAKRIIGYVVVLAVIGLGGLAWKYMTGAPETAKVGDCMAGQNANDLKTVDCGDAKAEWKVAGKVEGKSEAEAGDADAMCGAYPTSEVAYWEGKKGGKGYVLCLEPVKK